MNTIALVSLFFDKQLIIYCDCYSCQIGFNATFGFTAAFLNSYVSGQVVPKALDDPYSEYIGLFVSWVGIVAATASLIFRKGTTNQKESNLIFGATCFFGVVFPFVIQPNPERYGWFVLLLVYTLHGIGRATFEGTLKVPKSEPVDDH